VKHKYLNVYNYAIIFNYLSTKVKFLNIKFFKKVLTFVFYGVILCISNETNKHERMVLNMENLRGIGVEGFGLLFNRKSGKVLKCLTGNVPMLKAFAMNGVSASRDYVVFGKDGICYGYFEGRKNDMPKICKDMIGKKDEYFGIDVSQL
jgi:hypothetical protein